MFHLLLILVGCSGLTTTPEDTGPSQTAPLVTELQVREALVLNLCQADDSCQDPPSIYTSTRQCTECFGDPVLSGIEDFDQANAQACLDEMAIVDCPHFDASTLPTPCWDFLDETVGGMPEELFRLLKEMDQREQNAKCSDPIALGAPVCAPIPGDCVYDAAQANRCLLANWTCAGDETYGYSAQAPADCLNVHVCQ